MKVAVASLSCLAVGLTNVHIIASICATVECFMSCLPPDVIAALIYLTSCLLFMFALDVDAVWSMFCPMPSKLGTGVTPVTKAFVAFNWLTGHGVACSFMKVTMLNKVRNYSLEFPTKESLGGILTGDVDVMVFTRTGSEQYWESLYAQTCAVYLITVFTLLVGRKSWSKGAMSICGTLLICCFSGYLAERLRMTTGCILLGWVPLMFTLHQYDLFGALRRHNLLDLPCVSADERPMMDVRAQWPIVLCRIRDTADAMKILLRFNVSLGCGLSAIYLLGKTSTLSSLLIYGPASIVCLAMLKDKEHLMALSMFVAIIHGFAHVRYPFLDEVQGVVKSVDVWQDQAIHLLQAVIFQHMWWHKGKAVQVCTSVFTAACMLDVLVGYACWGQWCHELYVWVSLSAATASGIHVGIGATYRQKEDTQWNAHLLQAASAIINYFVFKGSDDILKLFAVCRFFELYFIIGHLHGFAEDRLKRASASWKSRGHDKMSKSA